MTKVHKCYVSYVASTDVLIRLLWTSTDSLLALHWQIEFLLILHWLSTDFYRLSLTLYLLSVDFFESANMGQKYEKSNLQTQAIHTNTAQAEHMLQIQIPFSFIFKTNLFSYCIAFSTRLYQFNLFQHPSHSIVCIYICVCPEQYNNNVCRTWQDLNFFTMCIKKNVLWQF